MMKRNLKGLSAILAGALLLGACTQTTPTPVAPVTSASPAQTQSTSTAKPADSAKPSDAAKTAVEKPKEIFMVMDTIMEEADGQKQVFDNFETVTGIKLRVLKPAHAEYNQKLALQFASNDIPDFCEVPSNEYAKYAAEGAFYQLDDLIANSKRLSQTPKDMLDVLRHKGNLYGIQKEIGNGTITYIREDWMKALNISMPKTQDEFLQMLRTFKEKDASGTGKTIPYLAGSSITSDMYISDWMEPGARFNFYKGADGKWVDGFAEDKMLKTLERLAIGYQEGLIEPDIFTISSSDARTKFYNGNVGAFTYWAGQWAYTLGNEIKRNSPNATLVAMPALEGTQFLNRIAPVYALPVKGAAKNPEGVFTYLVEYMYDGDKGQTWATHGVEGLTYKIEAGKYVALPALSAPDTQRPTPIKPILTGGLEYLPYNNPFALSAPAKASGELFFKSARQSENVPATKTVVTYISEITKLRSESLALAMKGPKTPAEVMERYKAEMKNFEVDTILKELNEN